MATSRPMPGVLGSSGKINTLHSKCQLKFTVDLCIFISVVIVSQAEYLAKLFPVLPVLPVPGASSLPWGEPGLMGSSSSKSRVADYAPNAKDTR
jgi:hypothetical protein